MEGWIKLHRKILDNPIIFKDKDYLAIWIYLLLNATHKEIPALFKGKKIILQKGFTSQIKYTDGTTKTPTISRIAP
mgnify:CR=1 FL=1